MAIRSESSGSTNRPTQTSSTQRSGSSRKSTAPRKNSGAATSSKTTKINKTNRPAGDSFRSSGEKPAKGSSPVDFGKSFGSQPMQLQDGKSLRKGSDNHQGVAEMQKRLNAQGAKLDVDGKFGRKTEKALREFQSKNDLDVDGVFGKKSLGKLNEAGPKAPAAPGPQPPAQAPQAPKTPQGQTPQAPQAPKTPQGQTPQAPQAPKTPQAPAVPQAPAQPAATNAGAALDQASKGQRADLGSLKTLQEARQDGKNLYFKAGGQIDVDGSGPSHGDPYKQYQTSLSLKGGGYPNADKVPYFVLPPQVAKQYGAKVGDLGLIRHNGQTIPAVFADVGPRNKIGELSRYAAQRLGIPDSPVSGGTNKGVEYLVFPGSRGPNRPSAAELTPEALQQRVNQLLAQQGR